MSGYNEHFITNDDVVPSCTGCGVLVGDPDQHDVWHRLQDALMASAHSASTDYFCAVCGLPVTWTPGTPCPTCGSGSETSVPKATNARKQVPGPCPSCETPDHMCRHGAANCCANCSHPMWEQAVDTERTAHDDGMNQSIPHAAEGQTTGGCTCDGAGVYSHHSSCGIYQAAAPGPRDGDSQS